MPANKSSTAPISPQPRDGGGVRRARSDEPLHTDLAALDAHEPVPDADAPELTEAELANGRLMQGGRPVGRPRSASPKRMVTLRLDPEILAHFQAAGPGWQTRINAALPRAARRAK